MSHPFEWVNYSLSRQRIYYTIPCKVAKSGNVEAGLAMWIKHPTTAQIVLVVDQAHIERLLGEGGKEVPDPRVPIIEVALSEESMNKVLTSEEKQPIQMRKRRKG